MEIVVEHIIRTSKETEISLKALKKKKKRKKKDMNEINILHHGPKKLVQLST